MFDGHLFLMGFSVLIEGPYKIDAILQSTHVHLIRALRIDLTSRYGLYQSAHGIIQIGVAQKFTDL